jgi:hypothetical protein
MAISDAPVGDRQRSAPNLSARVRKGQLDDPYRLAGLATHANRYDLLVIAHANALDLHAEHLRREGIDRVVLQRLEKLVACRPARGASLTDTSAFDRREIIRHHSGMRSSWMNGPSYLPRWRQSRMSFGCSLANRGRLLQVPGSGSQTAAIGRNGRARNRKRTGTTHSATQVQAGYPADECTCYRIESLMRQSRALRGVP